MAKPLQLTDPGVYFFKKPTKIAVRLNKNVLVMLHHPQLEGCGLVLHEAAHSGRELKTKLDLLLNRSKAHLPADPQQIKAKIFGLSYHQELLVLSAYEWFKSNRIELSAQDIGRNVRRNLLIDCATGNVGVRYAENYASGDSALHKAN